ncbi:BTAD domain-containing putative transcriptional regulator [Amycolatopsis sp. NPDC059021]|uniref:BTAD domain-containing putative transcriptional regulator n=1 Tax=Amycolatopsis sp. NPDC059021 TaxID=3346704 RepID=UPI00366AFAED
MRFGILGEIAAWDADGGRIALGGPRSRALLSLLALEAGHFVPAERLIDGMYGDSPPDGAANALQSQVSRLRNALKDVASVEFTSAGYRLDVDTAEVDVHRFEQLAGEGRRALASGEADRAAELLRDALALWRGPAFADVPEAPFVAAQVTRLDELRADAAGDRVDAELALGHAQDVVGELRSAIADHPLRERPRAQLIRALNASGRPADALAAFEEARRTLAEELGADPGPDLAEAHLAVLRGSPEKPSTTALPAQFTSFVGRDEELRQVSELLKRGRLVTLVGPGGTGKTRLAIGAAGVAPKQATFVGLAPYADDAELPQAVLAALGLRDGPLTTRGDGVARDPADRLVSALAERAGLLVLDNCEHLIDAVARLVARLLAACPGLRVLATSREPLGITGELLAPVPRLAVPPPGTSAVRALDYAAVRLFADRASAADPAFAVDERTIGDVQHVCAALDGLPLAIELAAARVRALPVGEIAARLDDRFRLLARGSRVADARHRSLRGVVEWSWDLLDEDERRLARRFTVFAGGATLPAAEQVTGVADTLDLLPGLVDKSLVEVVGGRYRMLETIRAFCAEQLTAAGEDDELRRAHGEYFVRLAEEADPKLRTADQLSWLDRLDAEYDNILAALRWSAESASDIAMRLVTALSMYWWMRGRRFEGAALALEVVRHIGAEPPAERIDDFVVCVLNAMSSAPDDELVTRHAALVEKYAEDRVTTLRHPALTMLLGVVHGPPGDDEDLVRRGEVLLADSDPWVRALVPTGLGLWAMMTGKLALAEQSLREGSTRFRALGERWGLSMTLDHLSQLLSWQGRYAEALDMMGEAIALMQELGATDDNADLLCRRGDSRAAQGDLAGAREDYEVAIALAKRAGMPESRALGYLGLAGLARRGGDLTAAGALSERALTECPGGSFATEGVRTAAMISLGWIAVERGVAAEAGERYRLALLSGRRWHDGTAVASALEGLAGVAMLENEGERAALLLGAAVAVRGTAMAGDFDVARVRSAARNRIGTDAFDRAYGSGLTMPRQKALTTAGMPAEA